MVRRSVLVVEDHDPYRRGLCRLIAASEHFRVAGETGNCHEAVRLAKLHQPDVTLMDVDLPGATGPCVARVLQAQRQCTKVVLLSMELDNERLVEAMRAGVGAYLSKETDARTLIATLIRVDAGENMFCRMILASPTLASRVLAEFRTMTSTNGAIAAGPLELLTPDEIETLEGVSLGAGDRHLVASVDGSGVAAGDRIASVLRKLQANDRTQGMLVAARYGWSVDEPVASGLDAVPARGNVKVVGTASASAR